MKFSLLIDMMAFNIYYQRNFHAQLCLERQNLTSRYLDDLLNIDNIYFDQMVDRIYPTEHQLNKADSSDTEAPFFGFESMYI